MAWSAPTTLGSVQNTTAASFKTLTGINASVGDLVIVVGRISSGGGGLTGVICSDSSTNTWTAHNSGNGANQIFTFASVIAAGKALSGGTITITRTGSTNITNCAIIAIKFTGSVTTSWEDTSFFATSTTATNGYSPTLTSNTPANSGDLAIAVLSYSLVSSTAFAYSGDAGHGWSIAAQTSILSNTLFTAVEYQTNAGTSALTYSPTVSGGNPGSENWMEMLTAYIASGGGGVTIKRLALLGVG